MARISLSDGDEAFECAPGDTILRAALRAGVGMSYSCNVGSCGNCRFELLEGHVTHLRQAPPAWTEKDRARNRWLGCQAAPEGDCRVKFRRDPAAVLPVRPAPRTGVLVARRDLNHDIAEFAIRVTGDPAFLPGQYALLSLPDVTGPRVYSMSNLPNDQGLWEFQIRRVPGGAATTALFDRLRPGDALSLDGPYGLAYLRTDAPRDLVLIAGGSGLSPMASIARGALAAPALAGRGIHVFFGGRGPADAQAAAFLADLDPGRLQLTVVLSNPEQAKGWTGPTGFVHAVAGDALGATLRDCEIYFAGPPAMATAVQAMLHGHGVPRDQIHFDEFY
jgi:toluene monooxygenase electron transfer component